MRKTCAVCPAEFEAKRAVAKYCSERCRKRAQRRPGGVHREVVPIEQAKPADWPIVEVTRRELEAAGRLDSVTGQQAMRLAERMCGQFDTGSAIAAISKELRAVMAEALADAPKVADSLDELAERRRRKAAGA